MVRTLAVVLGGARHGARPGIVTSWWPTARKRRRKSISPSADADRFALAEAGVGAQHGERAIPTGHRINEGE
jgi:hypothetical protein